MIRLTRTTLLIGAVAGVVFSGCDRVPGTDAYLIAKAEHMVSDQLLEPKSAIFRAVHVTKIDKGKLVCGLVNGRNEVGGYAPPKRFLAAATWAQVDPASPGDVLPRQGSVASYKDPRSAFDAAWMGAYCDGAPKP